MLSDLQEGGLPVDAIPLWEENAGESKCYLPGSRTFVQCYYDAFGGGIDLMGHSYQEFVARFLLELIETNAPRRELQEASAFFGFQHLVGLLAVAVDKDADEEAVEQYVASLA